MAHNFTDIVGKWYRSLWPDFRHLLRSRWGNCLRDEDIEDIYQEVFIAISRNLKNDKIAVNTSWRSYIMALGLNMASKKFRHIGMTDNVDFNFSGHNDEPSHALQRRVEEKLNALEENVHEDELSIDKNPEANEILERELGDTPESCAELIRLHCYQGLTDAKIAELSSRYSTAASVKVVRNRCMKNFMHRVRIACYAAGLTDRLPEIKQRKKGGPTNAE